MRSIVTNRRFVTLVSFAKTAQPIEVPFGLLVNLSLKMCENRSTFDSQCMFAVHVGATQWIRLNYLCAAVMRPYVKLLWPLVINAFSALTLLVGGMKEIWRVKNWVVECWHGYLSGVMSDLHVVHLLPLPPTVSCFSKIQIGFTFLVPAHLGSPGQRAVKLVLLLFVISSSNISWFVCCFQHLKRQQEGLSHLISIIKDDLEDVRTIEQGLVESAKLKQKWPTWGSCK